MNINKNNYEAFLLDLWEGNLSDVQKAKLKSFLEEHPELDEGDALSLFDDVSITESSAEFDKELINFESISKKNHEFFFIAYNEGDLSEEEMKEVIDFVDSNPKYAKKFDQFKRASLPEEKIIYPDKKGLLFDSAPIISIQSRNWLIGLAAASVAIFFWFRAPFKNVDNRYSMGGDTKINIKDFTTDPFTFNTVSKTVETNSNIEGNSNTLLAHYDPDTKSSGQNITHNKADENNSEEVKEPKWNSVSKIKASHLTNIVASIDSKGSKQEQSEAPVNNSIKEEIPTILELTTAYLQRKKVLNEERKPDFKGILNNTLSNVNNNEQPVLSTKEESNSKRTIFQLGDFKVERIAKK